MFVSSCLISFVLQCFMIHCLFVISVLPGDDSSATGTDKRLLRGFVAWPQRTTCANAAYAPGTHDKLFCCCAIIICYLVSPPPHTPARTRARAHTHVRAHRYNLCVFWCVYMCVCECVCVCVCVCVWLFEGWGRHWLYIYTYIDL